MRPALLIVAFLVLAGSERIAAQSLSQAQQPQLEERVSRLESQARETASPGAVLFLFGVFCALWAQNTGRNAWVWFFTGILFSVFTVLVLLSKNATDLRKKRGEAS